MVPDAISSCNTADLYVRIYSGNNIGDVVDGFTKFVNVNVIGFTITEGRDESYRQFVFAKCCTVTWML